MEKMGPLAIDSDSTKRIDSVALRSGDSDQAQKNKEVLEEA